MKFRNITTRILRRLTEEMKKRDFVEFDGVKLPRPENRWCTEEWKDNQFFVTSAVKEIERLMKCCGLKEDSKILDIGSGQGRLAIGLLNRLKNISGYYGVDAHLPSVEWCKGHIAAHNENFNFVWLDVRNARYNPDGIPWGEPFQFPFKDNSFDVIFLYSVFTHMLSDDIAVYLDEIYRLLKDDGRCFFTVFIEEDCEDEAENPPGYLEYLEPLKGPLHRVRFNKGYFSDFLSSHGFEIEQYEYRSDKTVDQSYMVVVKRP